VESPEHLWQLSAVTSLIRRQQSDGSWKYPGGGKPHLRAQEDYNQLETYRILGELVEKYGMDKRHPAIEKAAVYLFSRQTGEGDFRGIYGTQYSPNYSAAIMKLLIKAGYGDDSRIENGFHWLLSIRQNDGGWAIPLRTVAVKLNTGIFKAATVKPDKARPFSHLATGVVLRAFAAHEKYRKVEAAKNAGELLASRFFKKDVYPDRNTVDYWLKFLYPFWFTDLLSSLDSLSLMGFAADHTQIAKALDWFITEQGADGVWKLNLLRNKDKDLSLWLSLAICRVFKRFYG
jgi:squalene cyclase